MSSFSSKYIMFVLKNTEELSFITLKGDAKFEEKLTFSKWLEKFDKCSPEHSQSQNWDIKCMRLKFREELYVMSMKNDGKFGEGIELSFQIWHEKFDEFWPEYSKVSKICVLMGSFWPKYIMPELKSTEELCLSAIMIDAKFYGNLIWTFKNGMRTWGIWKIFSSYKIAISF